MKTPARQTKSGAFVISATSHADELGTQGGELGVCTWFSSVQLDLQPELRKSLFRRSTSRSSWRQEGIGLSYHEIAILPAWHEQIDNVLRHSAK